MIKSGRNVNDLDPNLDPDQNEMGSKHWRLQIVNYLNLLDRSFFDVSIIF